MKNYLHISIVFILIIGAQSCATKTGSGNIVTQTRVTGPFSGIKVSGDFDVEIRKGDKESVIVEADDNLIDNIETEVRGSRLIIRSTDNSLRDPHFKVYIVSPRINYISASASASVEVRDVISAESIEFNASSSGDIRAVVNTPEVLADASSSGVIRLSGKTRDLKANVSSSGDIIAGELLSENSEIDASSSGTAKVHASITLDASASSGAEVRYRGNATIKKSVSSGGEVEPN